MRYLDSRYTKAVCITLAIAGLFAYAMADWGPQVRLTTEAGMKSTISSGGRAITASGDVVNVVWDDGRAGGEDLYHIRSTNGGTTWQAEQRLTHHVGRLSVAPAIASSGDFVVTVWEDTREGRRGVFYKTSLNGGQTWTDDQRLTDDQIASVTPCVAVHGTTIHVVWSDGRDGADEEKIYYRRSDDRGSNWTNPVQLGSLGGAAYPAIAVHDTMVHVVWPVFDQNDLIYVVHYARSADGGRTWIPARRFSNSNTNQLWPTVAVWNHQVHVAWLEGLQEIGVYHRRSDDDGTTWTDARLVSNNALSHCGLAVWGQNVHITWMASPSGGGSTVWYQRSTDGGSSWAAADYRVGSGENMQFWPSVAAFGTRVHVAYIDVQEGPQVYYRGNPTGSAIAEPARPVFGANTLELRPNPFVRAVSAPGRENDWFEVYDLSGKKVGTYRGTGIGTDLLPGVYFVRDRAGMTGARIVKSY